LVNLRVWTELRHQFYKTGGGVRKKGWWLTEFAPLKWQNHPHFRGKIPLLVA